MSPINHFLQIFPGGPSLLVTATKPTRTPKSTHLVRNVHLPGPKMLHVLCVGGRRPAVCKAAAASRGAGGPHSQITRGRPAAAAPIAPCSCGEGIGGPEKLPHRPQGEGSGKDRLGRNPGPPRGWRDPEHRSSTTGIHLGEAEPSGKDIPDSRDGARQRRGDQ